MLCSSHPFTGHTHSPLLFGLGKLSTSSHAPTARDREEGCAQDGRPSPNGSRGASHTQTSRHNQRVRRQAHAHHTTACPPREAVTHLAPLRLSAMIAKHRVEKRPLEAGPYAMGTPQLKVPRFDPLPLPRIGERQRRAPLPSLPSKTKRDTLTSRLRPPLLHSLCSSNQMISNRRTLPERTPRGKERPNEDNAGRATHPWLHPGDVCRRRESN